MKLAFFQNNLIQQPNNYNIQSHQQSSHLPPAIQQPAPRPQQPHLQPIRPLGTSKQVVIQETLARPQQAHLTQSCDNQKPPIVLPKSNENSGFKSTIAYFSQQPKALPPLQPRIPLSQKFPPVSDQSSPQNFKLEETFSSINSHSSSQDNHIVNNENIPQPLVTDVEQPPQVQPPKSFKEKLALISTLQQPMGAYDYKKKHTTIAQPTTDAQPTPTFQAVPEAPQESSLPSLKAPHRRVSQRRPPSLIQPTI